MSLVEAAARARVYDLSQPYFTGMPHFPTHPPFLFSLTKLHGDVVNPGGGSSAAEAIAMSGHTGTHMDALSHFSCGGVLHGGVDAGSSQSYAAGMAAHAIDAVPPVVRRGILLDIALHAGVAALPPEFEIEPHHLETACTRQGVTVARGDVVLLRTGWAKFFREPRRFFPGASPGPALDGARWLSERGIAAAGSDTLVFERFPNPPMPVHVHLLVESGIHIIEVLQLEELAHDRVYEFLFVAAPLRITGGTGAPLRPLALI